MGGYAPFYPKESKRSNVLIVEPSCDELYEAIVQNEKALKFPFARNIKIDEEGEESYETILKGDLASNKTLNELQKTLKVLRSKSKLSIEEQGINTLYLTFGLLKWNDYRSNDQAFISPLVLVPVSLKQESLSSPHVLQVHEDEIVVNPTLIFKLGNDFGIELPEFDSDKMTISTYLEQVGKTIENENWEVNNDVNLTLLSFLKINMYRDLERNEEKLANHPIVSAIAGVSKPIILTEGLTNFDHDKNCKPIDTFQVVDADSSQLDAILLSKKGESFVLQGPPGTGKSQTITNIISEALADGKKVLFVSEKMAALQVVYKRLAQVGLSDFCLTLHSHKANKKDILRELSNSINRNKVGVIEEAYYKLTELEYLREKINKYHNELHTRCSLLNKSIFEVNGILANLDSIADLIFEIPDVEKFTNEALNTHKYLLDEFSKTIGKMEGSYSENPWYNSIVDTVTFELRHDIDANFKLVLPLLAELEREFQHVNREFELSIPLNIRQLPDLIEILLVAGKSPKLPVHWIYESPLDVLFERTKELKNAFDEVEVQTEFLTKAFSLGIFELSGSKMKNEIDNALESLKPLLNCQTYLLKERIVDQIDHILNNADSVISILENLRDFSSELSEKIGIQAPRHILDYSNFKSLMDALIVKIQPTNEWFEHENDTSISLFLIEAKLYHDEQISISETILCDFEKEIFDIDATSILKRFRTEYRTFFRQFKSQYRKDKKEIRGLYFNSKKLNDNEIVELLTNLKNYSGKCSWINDNQEKLIVNFGSYYKGLRTNWDEILVSLEQFQKIKSLLPEKSVSKRLKILLLENNLPIIEIESYRTLFAGIQMDDVLLKLEALAEKTVMESDKISLLINHLKKIYTESQLINDCLSKLNNLCFESISGDMLFKSINYLANIQHFEQSIKGRDQELRKEYDFFWLGRDTQWDSVLNAMEYAFILKELVNKYSLQKSFVERICTDVQSRSLSENAGQKLALIHSQLDEKLEWIFNLFDPSENFISVNLLDLIKKLSSCYEKKSALEEWIDYRTNRKRCKEAGLSDFINNVEKETIAPEQIVGTYLKRFYRLWLDLQLPQYETVQSFRRRTYEKDLDNFKKLDRNQFKIAQSRVRESVLKGLPDFNSATSSVDEVGVLKRELNKQRKLLPLRRLFNSIPNLLTNLKPCFMMSPLSVSVFLEAQSYEFDMVVFDEASQVCTEDAIGAIMRGKQVIIVGDSKQLPPTNFFATTLSDVDYDDTKDEADDTGAYESILDEALNAIPELSLRWHYRSRHEHLIAFSNAKIYDNRLVTFPSYNENVKDLGVEFVYVPNGIYDRGGQRNNIIEANKVADLVFEHFSNSPNRSLGVVTFSEAQQQAIDLAVRQRRLSNSTLDAFFKEEKEDPFFIKNLENVQGDERDTIIFSIGYAKDAKGIMYMNFGPLSRDGGYRRLNVAITRAKFNIKLVGSILSTDIDLEKSNSEGVKMLRSYIDFARYGMPALVNELALPQSPQLDSPFEESVFDFLISKGYKVQTQVGCSGFRIDMAVRHPKESGVFVLGIECDGASYHCSRTARERDRLRQSVLEDIGWRIYRIWSTDWIKDPISEGQNLINAVNNAIIQANTPKFDFPNTPLTNKPSTLDFEVVINDEPQENAGFGFAFYEIAKIEDVHRTFNDYKYSRDVIRHVLTIEQPIHFELLCKRVAPAWGNQKATSKIRGMMESAFDEYFLGGISRKDDFISFTSMAEVKARIPNPECDDSLRPINYISIEELSKAMLTIAQKSYGIRPEDLMIATAREFGFTRSGTNVTQATFSAYNYLTEKGLVKELEEKVVVV